MKKAYYLLFYKLYCFFKSLNEDGWEKWKALAIIGCTQIALVLECYVWGDVLFKNKNIQISNPYIVGVPLALFIAITNYYLLMHNKNYKIYENNFKKYSKAKSKMVGWFVFLFFIGVIGSLIFAFYQMSLIDWSKYR